MLFEWRDLFEENRDGFGFHIQLFHLSNEPASFISEEKFLRRLAVPLFDRLGLRKSIKDAVEFDSIVKLTIVFEKF